MYGVFIIKLVFVHDGISFFLLHFNEGFFAVSCSVHWNLLLGNGY